MKPTESKTNLDILKELTIKLEEDDILDIIEDKFVKAEENSDFLLNLMQLVISFYKEEDFLEIAKDLYADQREFEEQTLDEFAEEVARELDTVTNNTF